MPAQATPSPLTVRTKARAAVWKYLQIVGKSERKLPGVQIVVNHRVMAFNNEKALGIIKNGISSRAIDPLSEFLGIGKGEVAEYLDLDRTTALRRSTKDLPLPTHSAESVLRLLELDEIANDTFESEETALGWLMMWLYFSLRCFKISADGEKRSRIFSLCLRKYFSD